MSSIKNNSHVIFLVDKLLKISKKNKISKDDKLEIYILT